MVALKHLRVLAASPPRIAVEQGGAVRTGAEINCRKPAVDKHHMAWLKGAMVTQPQLR